MESTKIDFMLESIESNETAVETLSGKIDRAGAWGDSAPKKTKKVSKKNG
jgi:hypothetical protein